MAEKSEPKKEKEMELNIDIFTTEEDLASYLLEKEKPSKGYETEISSGLTVKYPRKQPIKKAGEEVGVRIALLFLTNVGAQLVANWIWDKIKDKDVEKLIIEREVVEKKEGEVKKVIKEKMEKKFD